MELPDMAIQLSPIAGLGALVATAVVAAAADNNKTIEVGVAVDEIQKKKPIVMAKVVGIVGPQKKSGLLPYQARDAWDAKRDKKRNNLHIRGQWFRYAVWSDTWFDKLNKMRFYAKPPGFNYVKSTSKNVNLCWMARCPPSWYPGYGPAANRNVRLNMLDGLIGPKADIKAIWGSIKALVGQAPEIAKSAGLIGAGVASGGQSATQDTEGQVQQLSETIDGLIDIPSGLIKGAKARKQASRALVTGVALGYRRQLVEANPHLIDADGKFNIGKRFKPDPQTWEDLFLPGNARPLIYNPPQDMKKPWPNY